MGGIRMESIYVGQDRILRVLDEFTPARHRTIFGARGLNGFIVPAMGAPVKSLAVRAPERPNRRVSLFGKRIATV